MAKPTRFWLTVVSNGQEYNIGDMIGYPSLLSAKEAARRIVRKLDEGTHVGIYGSDGSEERWVLQEGENDDNQEHVDRRNP